MPWHSAGQRPASYAAWICDMRGVISRTLAVASHRTPGLGGGANCRLFRGLRWGGLGKRQVARGE